jgi:mono/diheme cytochrome c family protein
MVLKSLLIVFLTSIFISCSGNNTKTIESEEDEPVVEVKSLYVIHCESCHGLEGNKGISGAADLSKSKLSDAQILDVIENGNKKGMMPYKDLISNKNERLSLVEFVKTLRK